MKGADRGHDLLSSALSMSFYLYMWPVVKNPTYRYIRLSFIQFVFVLPICNVIPNVYKKNVFTFVFIYFYCKSFFCLFNLNSWPESPAGFFSVKCDPSSWTSFVLKLTNQGVTDVSYCYLYVGLYCFVVVENKTSFFFFKLFVSLCSTCWTGLVSFCNLSGIFQFFCETLISFSKIQRLRYGS